MVSENTTGGESDGTMKVPLQEALLLLRSGGLPAASTEEYASVMGVQPPGRGPHEIMLEMQCRSCMYE